MKFNSLSGLAVAGVLSVTTALTSGCATTSKNDNSGCNLSGTKKLDLAINDAKSRLTNGCESHFDQYFGQLMNVAKGYPKASNSQDIQDYLRWSVNQGTISKVQAGDRYNRYFSTQFTSLNATGSVSRTVCPNLDDNLAKLRSEMVDKKLGIQEVLGNTAKYQQVSRLYQDLELNFDAICAAIEADR